MPDRYYIVDGKTFVWHEDKNIRNKKKHRIDFETAALVFNDDLRIEVPDIAHDSEEERYDTIGFVEDVLFVVCVDRENTKTGNTDIRIISARYATKIETEIYNNNIIGRNF